MNRRQLLGLAAAGVTAAASAGATTSSSRREPPLLFVHGSHGSAGYLAPLDRKSVV